MEVGRHPGMMANKRFMIGSNSYEEVKTFKYLGFLVTDQNSIQEEIKCRRKKRKFILLFSLNPFVFSTSLQEFDN